ncbi:hypothetical protein LZ198_05890 [Myxococcus sp. K15C18031901]|uniref:hypothetical protein n=1 Tax=Myxococcus dinghuensis TaxID=2906761 RepID=UPI0020A7F316|nr:hypothetical protein [Myxococcus dinghuensis]MCP3098408.1 hypothetical protein [Myxococcus dinghuensis]
MKHTGFLSFAQGLALSSLVLAVACNAPIETTGESGEPGSEQQWDPEAPETGLQVESSEPESGESSLLVAGPCADGTSEQTFAGGMVGCAGQVTWDNRASLCGAGYRLATATEWVNLRGTAAPLHNYWTHDNLRYSGSANACSVSSATGTACPANMPMRVCTANGGDAQGNQCNWRNCGYGTNTPNQYFGGCAGNTTAGALCVPRNDVPRGPCADGTTEQTFANGMVGCAGQVTWDKRASLCGADYRPATANEWSTRFNGAVPTHHYWTDDNLRYSGASNACSVSTTTGTACPANMPMRVCTPSGNDPQGNTCGWRNCGYGTNTPNRYFGGCAGNPTAGTLCVPRTPPGCADGSVEQTFSGGMVGCAGRAPWDDRTSLCAQGYRLATATEWVTLQGAKAPTHHYWTHDELKYNGSAVACYVSTTSGTSCGEGSSMRVCRGAGFDPEGNHCNWGTCGYGTSTPNQHFGGCGNTGGALCIPVSGCADGTTEQVFSENLVGCAGKVTWDKRASLCAPGWSVSNALNWTQNSGSMAPTHNYWTNDDLRYSGSASACSVSPTSGTYCGANVPMRVCTPAGNDPEGNACNWRNCGYLATTPNQYFGGCAGNTTAGTLCRR